MRVIGQKVTLRDMRREDVACKVRWFNDPEVNRTLLVEEKLDLDKSLEWFDSSRDDCTRRDLVIESKEGKPIGIMALVHIDAAHQTAECFCVIGDKSYWGGGIGTEAHILLADWGFKKVGLHKIWAHIKPENAAIIKVIERIGFRVEGTLREERVVNGTRIDLLRIGLLKNEFYAAHPELKERTYDE